MDRTKQDAALKQMQEESNAQVVAKVNGKPVTRGELAAAFEKVRPAGHWKNPIDATVALTDDEINMVSEAVVFFCGCMPEFMEVRGKPGTYRVVAAGYFMAIGA